MDTEETSVQEESTTAEVAVYDFRNPSVLQKEQTNTMRLIHDTFANTCSGAVSAAFGAEFEFKLTDLEQRNFVDYISSIPKPTCMVLYDMLPLHGVGVLQVSSNLVYNIIDKMLGGTGKGISVERAFTDIEMAIAKKILALFIKRLKSAWAYVMDLSFEIQEIQTNPSFVRVISPRELCVIASIEVFVDDIKGSMSICIPYVNLEPIASQLGNETISHRHSYKQTQEIRQVHEENFREVDFSIQAILGRSELTLEQLLFLSEGDMVKLDQKIRDPIELSVGGLRKYVASPGLLGRYKGVQVKEFCTEEE
ncbi:MAG: flagellar motor switch protein FliM [Waddliaceae bacterium]|nr:flagellar motor switch protein FliM [Waddliaceae bacterium]